MKNRYPVRTIIIGAIAIWVITVSAASILLEAAVPIPAQGAESVRIYKNVFETLAVMGVAIGATILAIVIQQWRTRKLFKVTMKKDRLFSVVIGVGVGIALILSLRRFDYPFSLPSVLLSGFVAGFTLCKLRSGIKSAWIKDSVIVGFVTYFAMDVLFDLPSIFLCIEHLGWANFVFLLGILGGAALGAILWGTISSIAGYSIISTKQGFMLFGVIARGLAVLLASVVTIVASGPLLGVTLPNGMERLLFPFVSSFESMARDMPAVVSLGIILTCFLSIFQQREILKKINIRRNLASLPLAIKILIGYGIFTWLAAAFYQGVTTGTLEVYPQYGLVSVLVLTGAFLACFAFLRKPAPEKGFLLIGFIIASIGAVSLLFAVPLYGRDSLWVGIANVNSLLVPIFFSIFMISWLHRKEIKMFINELRLKP